MYVDSLGVNCTLLACSYDKKEFIAMHPIRRLLLTIITTLMLIVLGTGALLAQEPTPTPDAKPERHVGLWLTDWQRIPISDTATDVIGWSSDGKSLLTQGDGQLYWWEIETQKATMIVTDVAWTSPDHKLRVVWDSEHGLITYPRQRDQQTAYLSVVDAAGRPIQTLLTYVNDLNPYLLESEKNDSTAVSFSLNDNGRFSVLYEDHIATTRANETEKRIDLPVALQRRLAAVESQGRDYWAVENYRNFWMAPDAQSYAVAVTRTLSIYKVGDETPLHEYDTPCGGEYRGSSRANALRWSPDGHSFYVRFDTIEGLAIPCYSAVQNLQDTKLYPLGRGLNLPTISGNAPYPLSLSWSSNGVWLIIGRPNERQCSSALPYGCVHSQLLIDRFGLQTPVIWWAGAIHTDDMIWLHETGAWSPMGRRYAISCSRLQFDEDNKREGAICILNFGWDQPATDPCATPLTPHLYCGEPEKP
jgi:hypothetical protein